MTIEDLRHLLSSRTRFDVQARPGDSQLLHCRGTVRTLRPDSGTVIFDEAGLWTFEDYSNIAFHNIYSWSLQSESSTLSLSHLRYGRNAPVHLVDFIEAAGNEWESASPYACGADIYRARINYSDCGLKLSWRIHGPNKKPLRDYPYLEQEVLE